MRGEVRVVCRPAIAAGFALAGLAAEQLPERGDPAAVLVPLLSAAGPAVLLIEESAYEALPPDLVRRLDRSTRPLVVPFPGPGWLAACSAEERVVNLLRQAIGYRVRLR